MGKAAKSPQPLSEADKIFIKSDFREWSGGYHPGEAGDEAAAYLEEWGERYGADVLEEFLDAWGEEELAAEESSRKAKKAQDLAHAATLPNNPKRADVWLEYAVPLPGPGGIPGCGLCDNKGTLRLKEGTYRYCLCPNGRALKHSARKGTVPA